MLTSKLAEQSILQIDARRANLLVCNRIYQKIDLKFSRQICVTYPKYAFYESSQLNEQMVHNTNNPSRFTTDTIQLQSLTSQKCPLVHH